ncbi:hypothetical protein GEMMAAP_18025 [Gemmatimonas phototrophica]|uniref:Uncharacterized protein n=1 Tax=Gemmatimonas phototrophica TaxID=1379270 RepID=A0A143BNT5_9BACT|nr:hypothetical protein GEMMAAP_18025 [Gemmatimonas phototrophica]
MFHAERRENALLQNGRERFAGDLLDHQLEHEVVEIGVRELTIGAIGQLRRLHHHGPCTARRGVQRVRLFGRPGTVQQHIVHGDLLGTRDLQVGEHLSNG